MALINSDVPNLLNGISQQPATLRLTSQGETQINGFSSIVQGLIKRLGSQHIGKLDSTALGATDAVYWIDRDKDNNIVYKYKLVRGISDQFIALELLEKKGFDKRLVKRAQDICKDISYKNKNIKLKKKKNPKNFLEKSLDQKSKEVKVKEVEEVEVKEVEEVEVKEVKEVEVKEVKEVKVKEVKVKEVEVKEVEEVEVEVEEVEEKQN